MHWVAVLISPVKSKSVEIFDSLADLSPLTGKKLERVVKELKEKVEALSLPYRLKLKTNEVRSQRANSSSCGFFAASFLLDRARGKTFAEASHYNSITDAEASLKPLEKEFKYL